MGELLGSLASGAAIEVSPSYLNEEELRIACETTRERYEVRGRRDECNDGEGKDWDPTSAIVPHSIRQKAQKNKIVQQLRRSKKLTESRQVRPARQVDTKAGKVRGKVAVEVGDWRCGEVKVPKASSRR